MFVTTELELFPEMEKTILILRKVALWIVFSAKLKFQNERKKKAVMM